MDQIVENGRHIFSEFEPLNLENDIIPINNLINDIPKFVLEDKNIKEAREKKYIEKDRYEEKMNEKQSDDDYDLDERIDDRNPVYKLNLAVKSIEVMGQILKNHYGLLEINSKVELGEEAFRIGLRSLKAVLDLFIRDTDIIVSKIASILEEQKITERLEIEKESRKILFFLDCIFSYFFMEKVASSIGSEHLSETLKKIMNKNDTIAFRLIDIAIKLSMLRRYPHVEIDGIIREIKNKNLPYTLLRKMVIDYMYMFPLDYTERQRICQKMDISMVAVQKKMFRLSAQERKR